MSFLIYLSICTHDVFSCVLIFGHSVSHIDKSKVVIDLPQYIHDLRGCGRIRHELWDCIESLVGLSRIFASRREIYLCIPTICSAKEVAQGPLVLWLSETFHLQNVFTQIPPPLLRHANATFLRPLDTDSTDSTDTSQLYIWVQGRLGNFFLDLANGLAAALQLGKSGVIFLPGFEISKQTILEMTTLFERPILNSLLSLEIGEIGETDEFQSLEHREEMLLWRRSFRRSFRRCVSDHVIGGSLVSASTPWATTPFGTHQGSFRSCSLPLPFRRRQYANQHSQPRSAHENVSKTIFFHNFLPCLALSCT